jgi:RNA polymerase sigma-70 factor (ECF subfamily)
VISDELSEQLLINQLNNGDMGAFRQIYRKYSPILHSFARKFTDRETAQDMVQDVFMRIWVSRETSPINESLQAYLFRAVRNRCVNHLEHLKIKADYENRQIIDHQIREALYYQSPEQLLIQQEQLDMIKQEIEKLPEKSREVFKMAYFEDKKASEIAEDLHISVRTVETQIYKALKTLRNVFYFKK